MEIQPDKERLKKAKEYEKVHNKLFLFDILISMAVILFFIFSGMSSWMVRQIMPLTSNNWLVILIYVIACYIGYSLLFLPINYYSGYALEHKFDLSNETRAMWFADYAKSFLLNIIFLLIFAEVLHFFVRVTEQWWWVWIGFFWLLFGIVISNIFPVVILPLFYKVKPLENPDLVARLIKLSNTVRAKILGVYEMDMSRKSKKANAMFAGLGNTKRIILSDTLVRDYSPEEIESVLAHELGHFYYRHIVKLLALSAAATFAGLYITNILLGFLLKAGGFGGIADIAALPLFAFVLSVFALFLMPATNTYSRVLEKEADVFAIEKTSNPAAFISSMRKLADQNLSDPDPNPAIEFILHSHPSISKRIKLAESYIKKER